MGPSLSKDVKTVLILERNRTQTERSINHSKRKDDVERVETVFNLSSTPPPPNSQPEYLLLVLMALWPIFGGGEGDSCHSYIGVLVNGSLNIGRLLSKCYLDACYKIDIL